MFISQTSLIKIYRNIESKDPFWLMRLFCLEKHNKTTFILY